MVKYIEGTNLDTFTNWFLLLKLKVIREELGVKPVYMVWEPVSMV